MRWKRTDLCHAPDRGLGAGRAAVTLLPASTGEVLPARGQECPRHTIGFQTTGFYIFCNFMTTPDA